MNIQDLLGLPLEIGLDFFEERNITVNSIETSAPLHKNQTGNDDLKDPYILRIREIDNNSLELLVSYF